MKNIFIILALCTYSYLAAQNGNVGIGTQAPDLSSILDVVATNKGILIPRVALSGSADQTTITNGNKISLLVYNTRTFSDIVPGFHYWNGSQWKKIAEGNKVIHSGTGPPSVIYPIAPYTGDMYIEEQSGKIYTFNGEGWLTSLGLSEDQGNILSLGIDGGYYLNMAALQSYIGVSNGLSKENGNHDIQLGGSLISPTTISTTISNTLAITGLTLEETQQNDLVTIQPSTGVLTRTSVSSILDVNEVVHIGLDGQTHFTTPMNINNLKKISVYRNGVRIGLTYVDSNTIKLEDGVVSMSGDEIRIVQIY